MESRTLICSQNKDDAGPTNNWEEPRKMRHKMKELFDGCMKGRTMYIIPFSMGPVGGPISQIGVEITDSAYVVVNMRIMARVGQNVLDALGKDGFFVPCLHSVGQPLAEGEKSAAWPCNPENTHIVHFPEEAHDCLLRLRLRRQRLCSARSASPCASPPPWLATRAGWPSTCSFLGVEEPGGKKTYVTAAFPSALRQDQLRHGDPAQGNGRLQGLLRGRRHRQDQSPTATATCVPSTRKPVFFGVAPGTSYDTNPSAMDSCSKDSIFTNVALDRRR